MLEANLCAQVERSLSLERDGRLPSTLRRRVLLHVAVCADCRAERDSIERVGTAARALDATNVIPAIGRGVRLHKKPASSRPFSAVLVAAVAAGLMLGLTIGYLAGSRAPATTTELLPVAPRPADPARRYVSIEAPAEPNPARPRTDRRPALAPELERFLQPDELAPPTTRLRPYISPSAGSEWQLTSDEPR